MVSRKIAYSIAYPNHVHPHVRLHSLKYKAHGIVQRAFHKKMNMINIHCSINDLDAKILALHAVRIRTHLA